MKLPADARGFARKALGLGRACAMTPEALVELARREPVVVVGVGIVRPRLTDARLPGEQRVASLLTLSRVVEDIPHDTAIVMHCG